MAAPLAPITDLASWQQVVVILVAAAVLAKLVLWATAAWLNRSERLAVSNLDRIIVEEVRFPLYVTVILGGVHATLPILGLERVEFVLGNSILTAIVVLWVRAGVRSGARTVRTWQENGREVEFAPVLKNLWSFMLLLGGFLLLLDIWEFNITPLLASAGVIGIVLGIAAQDSIGNLFAGMSLHLDKTFVVGDMIQLADGTRGTVTDLSIRSTTIVTRDNVAVTIPNAELNQSQLVNESSPVRRRRIRLPVGVAYGSDLGAVEDALLEAARSRSVILDSPPPRVRFQAFDDSAITVELHCHIEHPALLVRARDELIREIDERFRDADITIPFPQRELSFLADDNEISVRHEAGDHSDTVVDEGPQVGE